MQHTVTRIIMRHYSLSLQSIWLAHVKVYIMYVLQQSPKIPNYQFTCKNHKFPSTAGKDNMS